MLIPANPIVMLVRAMSGGGAQQDALELALGLAAAGWPVVVATLDSAGPLRARVAGALPLLDLGHGKKLRMAWAVPALRTLILQHRPAAIIASEAAANVLAGIAVQSLPTARRPALLLREVAAPLRARQHDPYLQNRIGYRLAPWLYPCADRVLSFTEGVRSELISHFSVRPERAVNLGNNAVLSAARLQKLSCPLTRVPRQVIAVGRLSPEKDFATLIRAFARLPGLLTILGEGPQRSCLEQLVGQLGLGARVFLPGFSADPLEQIRRARLLVSSSLHEGFGNGLVEALACGTPVVATDVPHGPSAILDRGRFGLLVPPSDPTALAIAIERAIEAPVDRAALQARAADFTTERAAARFGDVLRELGLSPTSATEVRA